MAKKKKFELKFDGLEEYMHQLQELEQDIIPIADEALEATHKYITPLIHEKMQDSNLPAKGAYSSGKTREQIIDDINIVWNGANGSIDIGFSLEKGLTPIFLIHGTSKMKPAKGLKSVIYGKKTKEEIAKIQEEIFVKRLQEAMLKK